MTIYIIWEKRADQPNAQIMCYANTPYWARRECLRLARDNCPEGTAEKPLWKGEMPDKQGPILMYTLPGPNESSVAVCNAYEKWFGRGIEIGTEEYRAYFTTLEKASMSSIDVKEPVATKIDARAPDRKIRKRPNDTPFNQMLNAIEAKRNSESTPDSPSI